MKTSNIVIGVLLAVICALVLYLIFSKPAVVVDDHQSKIEELENQILQDELVIQSLTFQADSLLNVAVFLDRKADSLEQVKTKVKHHYHEIYVDIASASNNRLDSIIRSNW